MKLDDQQVCAECGATFSDAPGRELGCRVCLLQVGLMDQVAVVDQETESVSADELGPYKIVRRDDGSRWELGRGAMGITYRALDETLGRPVALKIVNPHLAGRNGSAAERFIREARAAAALRHQNIATIHHFGIREETGQCFYAMELVEGETLEDRVRRTGPLDVRTTIAIAQQVVAAITAAEKSRLIHRDLKPANLMLVDTGEDGAADGAGVFVKVIDFGLAKAIEDTTDPMSLTYNGFVGTPAYASPEQFARTSLDARSDIYSLGATLWFALTGKAPFSGRTVEEIQRSRQSGTLPHEQLKAARVPQPMIALLESMLSLEPAARPGVTALPGALRSCSRTKLRPRLLMASAGLLIAIAAIAFFGQKYFRLSGPTKSTQPKSVEIARTGAAISSQNIRLEKSIAVLPFVNLSREASHPYFVAGLRAQIVARLLKLADLTVVSDSLARPSESAPENVRQIAAELGVVNVLRGSLESDGDRFRISVRLTDAKNNVDLWAKSYDRSYADISSVESDVAREVTAALGVKLSEPERRALSKVATSNPQAYEAYLEGRDVWLQRTYDSYREAGKYFERAIALDPNYAAAYAGLADSYQFTAGFILQERSENFTKAKNACKRALELDPNLAEAHASLGLIAMNYDWDWALAETELQRAIALDPSYAMVHDWYAEYLMAVGRPIQSLGEIERARELDPFSLVINCDVGKMLYFARSYPEAEKQLKQTDQIDPGFSGTAFWLGQLYATEGQFEDALNRFETYEREGAGPSWAWGLMAYTYGKAGRQSEARQMVTAMEKSIGRRTPEDKLGLAFAYIGLGDKDRAFACLEQDYQNRSTAMVSLKTNPWFDSLRSDPRFQDLIRRVHLPR